MIINEDRSELAAALARELVEAAQAGFATGLASDRLDQLLLWHGCPYEGEAQESKREAWLTAYQAGRAASRGIAGSLKGTIYEERSFAGSAES